MFDVFYSGTKPNLFAHEQAVDTIEQAQQQSRTRFFWFVNYLCDYTNFDFLWEPVPWEAQQRHVWPSQWQKSSGTYLIPAHGYTDTNYHASPVITRLPDRADWHVPSSMQEFDWSWHPDPTDPVMQYQFGTQHQATGGPSYGPSGADTIKYVEQPRACTTLVDMSRWTVPEGIDTQAFDWTWHPDSRDTPYIYKFGTQWQKTGGPVYTVPGAIESKFVSTPRATKILPDTNWTVPTAVDVGTFDWTWHPDSTEAAYIYQFGTQHQRTGGPVYTAPGATELKFVDQIKIRADRVATAVIEIDHLDGHAGQLVGAKTVRYFDNYLDTLLRVAKNVGSEHEFVWICSSICDYTNFDFSWHPEQWQAGMLHVFPSNEQKFGDTFFMHVPTFRDRAARCQLLEWYDLNFVDIVVPRRPMPVIQHHNNSQVDAVKNSTWAGPLATFTNTDYVPGDLVTVPLWRAETKTIVPLSAGASSVIVPRTAVGHIQTQLYDYPYIDRTHRMLKDAPLDIVFISNGEPAADETFVHLQNVTGNLFREQKIHHVKGVNGRVAAYHAAAESSNTPWFFAVFAKLFVNENFDWDWQPDRMQQPKHYIFHALNPVNGLEYGHQAMIAYNKQLVLANTGKGLDFTLDDEHEVVPILSGTAVYNMSPWVAWRTAFREALKLKMSLPDVENEFRLTQWLSTNPGSQHIVNEEWSRWGAEDAVEYFNEVNAEFTALKKSYEWDWLASYAFIKRSLVPDQ